MQLDLVCVVYLLFIGTTVIDLFVKQLSNEMVFYFGCLIVKASFFSLSRFQCKKCSSSFFLISRYLIKIFDTNTAFIIQPFNKMRT